MTWQNTVQPASVSLAAISMREQAMQASTERFQVRGCVHSEGFIRIASKFKLRRSHTYYRRHFQYIHPLFDVCMCLCTRKNGVNRSKSPVCFGLKSAQPITARRLITCDDAWCHLLRSGRSWRYFMVSHFCGFFLRKFILGH